MARNFVEDVAEKVGFAPPPPLAFLSAADSAIDRYKFAVVLTGTRDRVRH